MFDSDELRKIADDLDRMNSFDIGTGGRIPVYDMEAELAGYLHWDENNSVYLFFTPQEAADSNIQL